MGRHRIVGALSTILVGSCWPSVAFGAVGITAPTPWERPGAVVRPAATEPNPVADWATIVQPAIHNAGEPRPPAS